MPPVEPVTGLAGSDVVSTHGCHQHYSLSNRDIASGTAYPVDNVQYDNLANTVDPTVVEQAVGEHIPGTVGGVAEGKNNIGFQYDPPAITRSADHHTRKRRRVTLTVAFYLNYYIAPVYYQIEESSSERLPNYVRLSRLFLR